MATGIAVLAYGVRTPRGRPCLLILTPSALGTLELTVVFGVSLLQRAFGRAGFQRSTAL